MKASMAIIIIFLVILSFHSVSALEIESYKITAEPVNGNYVENIIELTVRNDKEVALTQGSLNIAKDAKIQGMSDSFGSLQYTIKEEAEQQKMLFSFTIPIKPEERRVITLETITYNIIQREGYFEYLLVLVPPKDISSFVHILKLEKDVELYSIAGEEYIIVPDATITETNGNLIIEWDTALKEEIPAVFLVRFRQETGINYWKWFGIIVIALGIGAICGIGANKAFQIHKQKKALKATNILNEREKAVLDIIIKNPEIKQYDIVKQLGYTKSNMSKIVKRLEFRGLIEVKKEGKIRILNVGETLKKQL